MAGASGNAALAAQFAGQMVVSVDSAFHGQAADPSNMKACQRGTWNTHMFDRKGTIDADYGLLSHPPTRRASGGQEKIVHQQANHFRVRLASGLRVLAIDMLVQRHVLNPDEPGKVQLSSNAFSLQLRQHWWNNP